MPNLLFYRYLVNNHTHLCEIYVIEYWNTYLCAEICDLHQTTSGSDICVRDGNGATQELCAAPKRTRSHEQPDPQGNAQIIN